MNGHLLFAKRDETNSFHYESIPHFHGSIEIYLCTRGKFTLYMNGETYKLFPGDIAFVDRFVPHTSGLCQDDGVGTAYIVVASSMYLDGIKWLQNSTLNPITRYHSGYEKIEELVLWAYNIKSDMNEDMRCGFVALLLGMMYDHCGSTERINEKNTGVLIEVMRYIDDHFSEKIDLDTLSKQFGYEKTYLSRSFNKFFGMNLREYVNRRRVAAFQRFRLINKDTPILKAAEICGFDSPNTYYRAMEKYADQKLNF